MSNGQAPRGGIVGKNGEFYAGGQFLPSTHLPKRHEPKPKPTGPRRVMIDPFTWTDRRDGYHAIYSAIVGTYAQVNRSTGIMSRYTAYQPYDTESMYLGTPFVIADLIARYNAGERWFRA